jgi:hypothetical protein
LGMPIPAKQNGKIVKPSDDPLELDTVHKENRYRRFTFPHVVQEHILNVLRFLVGHGYNPSFCVEGSFEPIDRRFVARPPESVHSNNPPPLRKLA